MDLDRLGGIVTKAVSLEPREGNPAPRVAEFPGGMLNSVGLANPGLARVRTDALPWLAGRLTRARILVNVVGFTEPEYAEVIAGLEACSRDHGLRAQSLLPQYRRWRGRVRGLRRLGGSGRVLLPVGHPARPDCQTSPAPARHRGRWRSPRSRRGPTRSAPSTPCPGTGVKAGSPRLGAGNGGVSGPGLLPVGLQAVRLIRAGLPGTPVIGVGGVRTAADMRRYLDAGAAWSPSGPPSSPIPGFPSGSLRSSRPHDGADSRPGSSCPERRSSTSRPPANPPVGQSGLSALYGGRAFPGPGDSGTGTPGLPRPQVARHPEHRVGRGERRPRARGTHGHRPHHRGAWR